MSSQILTQEYLKECLLYNPNTGLCVWKERPLHHFKVTKKRTAQESMLICNKANSEKIAGSLTKSGYEQIRINKKTYRTNKLVWLYMTGHYPSYPKEEVDHKDQIRNNNKWKNLRIVDRFKNMQNRTLQSNNKSGVIGVSYMKEANKWRAQLTINKKLKILGRFKDFNDAVFARYNEELNNSKWEFNINSSSYNYLKKHNLLGN